MFNQFERSGKARLPIFPVKALVAGMRAQCNFLLMARQPTIENLHPPVPSSGDASLQRKRAAGESDSEWGEDSEESDSDYGSGDDSSDDGGARSKKEAAFAKVLKDMMAKRDSAEPGVLQEVCRIASYREMLENCCLLRSSRRPSHNISSNQSNLHIRSISPQPAPLNLFRVFFTT